MERKHSDHDLVPQPPSNELNEERSFFDFLKKIRWCIYVAAPVLVALGLTQMDKGDQPSHQQGSSASPTPTPAPEKQDPDEQYKELLDAHFTELRKAYVDGDQEKIKSLLDTFANDQKALGLTDAVAQYDLNWCDVKRTSAIRNLTALCDGTADQSRPLVQGLVRVLRAYRALETAQDDDSYARAYQELNAALESSGYTLKSIGSSPWDVMGMNVALMEKEGR